MTLDNYLLKFEHIPEDHRRIRRLYHRDRFSNWLQRLGRSIKKYMKLNRGKQNNGTRSNSDTAPVVHQKDTSHNTGAQTHRRWGRRRISVGWHRGGDIAADTAAGQRSAAKSSVVDDQLDLENNVNEDNNV
jgi:hypothetical protein